MLFDAVPAYQVIRLDTLLTKELYWDSDFVNDLKVETNGYGLSLVSTTVAIDALAGPTWGGVLVKLIQCFKAEMAKSAQDDALASANPAAPQAVPSDTDIVMKEADASALVASPSRKWSISSSSSSLLVDTQSAQNYADQSLAKTRQAWYYAVLFKASTHELPGTLSLTPESDVVVSSEDVSKYFPLEDPLSIGSSEYIAVEYNPRTRKIRLGGLVQSCSMPLAEDARLIPMFRVYRSRLRREASCYIQGVLLGGFLIWTASLRCCEADLGAGARQQIRRPDEQRAGRILLLLPNVDRRPHAFAVYRSCSKTTSSWTPKVNTR